MGINFRINSLSHETKNISYSGNSVILQYPCGDILDECSPYYAQLPPGTYIFEVWGAQGGFDGGKGGYSTGVFSINRNVPIYVFIGSHGSELIKKRGPTTAAFNGGGKGYSQNGIADPRSTGSGGGGTDIRVAGDSLYHRIIVAGGGGGRSYQYSDIDNGDAGFGGGTEGGDSKYGKGGLQDNSPAVESGISSGKFGEGGSAPYPGTSGGGGGGWFGGSTGKSYTASGGAGGSGYVLNETSYKPEGYQLNDTQYYLMYTNLISGDSEIPSCKGYFHNNEKEEGHSGHGCARITILSQIHPCTNEKSSSMILGNIKALFCIIFIKF